MSTERGPYLRPFPQFARARVRPHLPLRSRYFFIGAADTCHFPEEP